MLILKSSLLKILIIAMLIHFSKLLSFSLILFFIASLANAQDRYVCYIHGIENSNGLSSNKPTTIIGLWNSLSDNAPDAGDVIHIQNGYTYYVKEGSVSKKSRLAIIRGSTTGYVTWLGDNVCTAGSHSGSNGNEHPVITGTEEYSDFGDWSQYFTADSVYDIWYTEVQSDDFNVTIDYPVKNWEPNSVFFKAPFDQTNSVITWGRRQASITNVDTIGEFHMVLIDSLINNYRLFVFAISNPVSFYDGVFIPQIAAGAWLIGDDDQVKLQHLEFRYFPTAIKVSNSSSDAIIEDCRFQWIGIGPDDGASNGWTANGDAINMQGRGIDVNGVKIINNFMNECGVHGIFINSQTINTFVENIFVDGNEILNCYHTGIDVQNIVSAADMTNIIIRNNDVRTAVDTILNWNTKAPICVGIQVDGTEGTDGTEYNIDKIDIYNNVVIAKSRY